MKIWQVYEEECYPTGATNPDHPQGAWVQVVVRLFQTREGADKYRKSVGRPLTYKIREVEVYE
jgi:hypothetical protein